MKSVRSGLEIGLNYLTGTGIMTTPCYSLIRVLLWRQKVEVALRSDWIYSCMALSLRGLIYCRLVFKRQMHRNRYERYVRQWRTHVVHYTRCCSSVDNMNDIFGVPKSTRKPSNYVMLMGV